MATLEDDKTRRPDSQDERNRKERESVTEGRTEQKRPVEDKTSGAGPGVSSGKP
jgi:hypothetical protein